MNIEQNMDYKLYLAINMYYCMTFSKSEQLLILKKLKDKIKKNDIVIKMFKDYNVDISELDFIPLAFADLDVSAKTDHGIIYLNTKLLTDSNIMEEDHYLPHEITHWLQQTTGTKPTKGSDDGDYLENEFEQEAFQNQTKYISDVYDENEAEEYINQVLEHHDVDDDEKAQKRKKLLRTQFLINNLKLS